jgi:hypothetical protein
LAPVKRLSAIAPSARGPRACVTKLGPPSAVLPSKFGGIFPHLSTFVSPTRFERGTCGLEGEVAPVPLSPISTKNSGLVLKLGPSRAVTFSGIATRKSPTKSVWEPYHLQYGLPLGVFHSPSRKFRNGPNFSDQKPAFSHFFPSYSHFLSCFPFYLPFFFCRAAWEEEQRSPGRAEILGLGPRIPVPCTEFLGICNFFILNLF